MPVVARVMAIVDVYDALTTNRSYRTALTPDVALSIMEEESRKGCMAALQGDVLAIIR